MVLKFITITFNLLYSYFLLNQALVRSMDSDSHFLLHHMLVRSMDSEEKRNLMYLDLSISHVDSKNKLLSRYNLH